MGIGITLMHIPGTGGSASWFSFALMLRNALPKVYPEDFAFGVLVTEDFTVSKCPPPRC